ncbi:Protein of unknown function [Micromonospora rhizosphaerae]|uniref:DUF3068 domain-containing protein n=1 Tax=Micromonospora rhizosphaerae TaxID=568872 RepID=A0A1C6RDH3_9ACTN|nr:DUF3068 domain-containing protein [Micromonospora rhizosphaerae]SCL15152.1 Protein of unknown function [Micromonospora rhizosphaerae]
MKLRVGAALFGLGVLLLVFAAGLPLYVAPAVTKLPYDLSKTTSTAQADNARFLKITKVGDSVTIDVPQATLVSNVEVIPQPEDTADRLPKGLVGKAVIWDVYQTVKRDDTKEVVSQYSTELALDRVSGAAAAWDDQWLNDTGAKEVPVGNITYSGQVYKFPFGTQKKDYDVFDRDLRQALPAKFTGTETIGGLEAYRFEQRIENATLQTPEGSIKALLGRFSPGASVGKVVYSNTRTLWVDPVTGAYLKVREQQHKELQPDVGETTVLLEADFNYTPDTIANSVKTAKSNRMKIDLVRLYVPIGAGVLGLLALVVGVLLVVRANGGDAARYAPGTATVAYPQGGGPLTDEIPPATTNWRADGEPTVPDQRAGADEPEKR